MDTSSATLALNAWLRQNPQCLPLVRQLQDMPPGSLDHLGRPNWELLAMATAIALMVYHNERV